MPGLRWTPRGAVALPETLQIRLAPSFAGRVQAGAPLPGRALTLPELEANLAWFTRTGPRGRPVRALVLSGLSGWGIARAHELEGPLRQARRDSVQRVILHADGAELPALLASPLGQPDLVDQLAVAVRHPEEVPADSGRALDLVIPLEQEVLPRLGPLVQAARAARPRRLVFTWPFPSSAEPPPSADRVVEALTPVIPEDLPWIVKGLPVCALAGLVADPLPRVSRSGNRWYVDAEHQLDRALLFLPDVLRFSKREGCRFCEADDRCDGVAEQWLRQGLVAELVPLRGDGPRGVG